METLAKMHDETQALRAENERLKGECESAQLTKSTLDQQLGSALQAALSKDAELAAAAAIAQEHAKAQRRLEADLIAAREQKKLMEQAMVRLPLEAQKRHEAEAERLRNELDSSRRCEEKLTKELRAQVYVMYMCTHVMFLHMFSVCVCVCVCVFVCKTYVCMYVCIYTP